MDWLSKRLCFFLCIAELMYNETRIVNDFARIIMSSGQLGLFLKCLFNPFIRLRAKSLQTISCADGVTWISLSILLEDRSSGRTNMHKIIPETHRLPTESTCVLQFIGFSQASPSKESEDVIQFHHLLCELAYILRGKYKVTAIATHCLHAQNRAPCVLSKLYTKHTHTGLSMTVTELSTFLSLSPETVSMYCSWIMKAARLAV